MTDEVFGSKPLDHYIPQNPDTDDAILDHAQSIRQMVINAMVAGGLDINDNKKIANLEKFLRAYDGQALTKKRIEAQAKTGDGLQSIAHVLENYLQRRGTDAPKFERHEGIEDAEVSNIGPANLDRLTVAPKEFIEGQLEASGTAVDIDRIMIEGRERARGGATPEE